MTALAIILGGSAALMAYLIATAPEGFEDETGFHEGPEPFVPPSGRSR